MKLSINKSKTINQYSLFALVATFLGVAFNVLYNKRLVLLEKIPSLENYNFYESITSFSDFTSYSFKIFIIFAPIVFFSLIELIIAKGNLLNRFKKISLGRCFFQDGKKTADVWYLFLTLLTEQIPLITIIATMGLSRSSTVLSSTLKNLYTNLFGTSISQASSILMFVILILLKDFVSYLKHYFEHKIPIIWDTHECHHSATEMTLLNNFRETPLQNVYTAPLILPMNVLVGLYIDHYLTNGNATPLILFIIWTVYEQWQAYAGHCNFAIIFPKPISYLFMSPGLHLIHHSTNPKHFDKNFGTSLPYWDRLFGTYLSEENLNEVSGFGIHNTEYNKYHPLYCYSLLPFKKLTKRLKTAIKYKTLSGIITW